MKTKLFIDFDGTLFDTRCFKKGIFNAFISAGFSEKQVNAAYKIACKDYLYSPVEHLEELQEIKKFESQTVLSEVEELYKGVPGFLFRDTLEFLQRLDRDKYEVILLTLGDKEFQKRKVESSGISEYFDKVYYCTEQKWIFLKSVVEIDEKFYIIDDRGDALFKISKAFKNCVPIEINYSDIQIDIMEQPSNYDGFKIKNIKEAVQYL